MLSYDEEKLTVIFICVIVTGLILGIGLSGFSGSDQPPVYFILIESLPAEHTGKCYGYERNVTPAICDLAQDGVMFTEAYSQSTSTPKSVATLFTARTPREHGFKNFSMTLSPKMKTIFEAVEGDYSIQTKKNTRLHETNLIQGGNQRARDDPLLDLGSENQKFLFRFYVSPHTPYSPATQYRKWDELNYSNVELHRSWDAINENLTISQRTNLYDGELLTMNQRIKHFIDRLKSEGRYEKSLIIVTSDHGEWLGRYGKKGHAGIPYRPVTNVPLIIKLPHNRYSGQKIDEKVRHMDISPTILDIIGKSPEDVDPRGKSFLPLIKGNNFKPPVTFSADEPKKNWVLRGEKYKLFMTNPEIGCKNSSYADEYLFRESELLLLNYTNRKKYSMNSERPEKIKKLRESLCDIYEPEKEFESHSHNISDELEERLRKMGYIN